MENLEADTVIVLSSELISQVMEVHFNAKMFKIPVKIVDLRATEGGYAFNVAFIQKDKGDRTKKKHENDYNVKIPSDDEYQYTHIDEVGFDGQGVMVRDKKGRFAKHE